MHEQPATKVTNATPGERLQQARLAQRLSVEDIAKTLRLSPKQIVALEANDYERLPGPTYVRGYLRAYAQLVGLPAGEIVEGYNRLAAPAASQSEPPVSAPPELTSSDRNMQIATVAVVVAVLGLAAAWWFGQAKDRSVATTSPAPGASPAPAAPGAAEATLAPHQPGSEVPTPSGVQTPPASASSEAARPAAAAPGVAAVKPPQPPVETKVVQAPTPAPSAMPPKARLVLQTTAESWADVRDAHNRLLYETLPAGRTVTLEGTPPFNVFLGNVDGVRVEYNGRPYDAGPSRRGPTARFTLGAEGR